MVLPVEHHNAPSTILPFLLNAEFVIRSETGAKFIVDGFLPDI
jgi:hypothetical protein